MDTAYLTACAALAGSAVGGLTSLAASWISQQGQVRAQQRAWDKNKRQDLYREFIDEASKLHGDSLVHDEADISFVVGVYALISRMRVTSSPMVIRAAER